MTRIPQLTERDQVAGEHVPVFDAIAGSRGSVRGPFSVLMHSPELAGRTAHLGAFVRFESSLAPEVAELAVITVAREFDCAYEWSAHDGAAREAGVTEATIEAVRDRLALDGLAAQDQALIGLIRSIVREHKVGDAAYAAVHAILGDRGTTELIAAVGYYCLLACVLNTFEVPPRSDADQLPS